MEKEFVKFLKAVDVFNNKLEEDKGKENHKNAAIECYEEIKDINNNIDWLVPFWKAYALFISQEYTCLKETLPKINFNISFNGKLNSAQGLCLYFKCAVHRDIVLYRKLCKMYIAIANMSKAQEYSQKSCVELLKLNQDKYESNYIYLYSFRKITDYAIGDIMNNSISLSRPNQFNDPFDSLGVLWAEHQMESKLECDITQRERDMFLSNLNNVRIRCFVGNDNLEQNYQSIQNILMWSHYADNHNGICIEYRVDINKLLDRMYLISLQKVRYDLEEKNLCTSTLGFDRFFTQKSPEWKYESEYRLIDFDPEINVDYKTISLEEFEISKIYFGLRCSMNNKKLIKKISKSNVQFFQMEKNVEDIYNLKFKEVESID